MRTVILGEQPPKIAAFLARRRALDQDRFDEIREGDDHLVPAPHPWHSHLDHQLTVFLNPFARTAGLVGLSEFDLGQKRRTAATCWPSPADLEAEIDWPG